MRRLIALENLNVRFGSGASEIWPVRNVSFSVNEGETLCIVGESGSGKSLTGLALLSLLPSAARSTAERYELDGKNMTGLTDRALEDIRGKEIAMIFQEPMTSLNPAFTVGDQLTEVYRRHIGPDRKQARARAAELLGKVGIANPEQRLAQYPHQLSGGLRQRVMIAMALICDPKVIVADEPTTALDVTVQAQILALLKSLQREYGLGLVLITHDLGVVAKVADRVAVMYAGQIVETGTTAEIFRSAAHPYTEALLGCIPLPGKTRPGQPLRSIPGTVPVLFGDLGGCHFRNRCAMARPGCAGAPVELGSLGPGRAARCIRVTQPERYAGEPRP